MSVYVCVYMCVCVCVCVCVVAGGSLEVGNHFGQKGQNFRKL